MTLPAFHGAKAARSSAPKKGRGIRDIDRGLLTCFVLLMMIGLATLYAASYYNAQDNGGALSEVLSQLFGYSGTGAWSEFLKYLIAYPTDEFNERFTNKTYDPTGRIARKAAAVRKWMKEEYGIDVEQMAE